MVYIDLDFNLAIIPLVKQAIHNVSDFLLAEQTLLESENESSKTKLKGI